MNGGTNDLPHMRTEKIMREELEKFLCAAMYDYEQEHEDWIENKEAQVRYLVTELLNQFEITKKQLEFKMSLPPSDNEKG